MQDFAVQSVEQIDDASKRVRVQADVRSLDTGVVRPRSLLVTMRRQGDRWMITELR